ncbi:MAG TPA: hypothetical protein VF215_16910 [Thermoanaerobaculia bacterium]
MKWERTGSIDPRALVDARLQLHWAAQAVAGVGRTLHEPRADDSHTSFTWAPALDALVQEPVDGITCGIRPRDLTLIAIGATASELALHGRTLDDAFAFLESHFGQMLKRPDVELPDHMVARGGRFDADPAHLAELSRYYSDAALVLEDVVRAEPNASPVRCWPHHFDIATLIALGEGRTIGIGLSPGDAVFPEPYYYVTPWPYPDVASLGALKFGRWNTLGWTGAVLLATEFAHVDAQEAMVRAFIADAMV